MMGPAPGTMYVIHRVVDGQSVPLMWSSDQETADALGESPKMAYAFLDRDAAKAAMEKVQTLFDLDDAVADTLHIVRYTPS